MNLLILITQAAMLIQLPATEWKERGLWAREARKGKKYFKGKFSPRYILIMPRLSCLNTNFRSFNWNCDPRIAAGIRNGRFQVLFHHNDKH